MKGDEVYVTCETVIATVIINIMCSIIATYIYDRINNKTQK